MAKDNPFLEMVNMALAAKTPPKPEYTDEQRAQAVALLLQQAGRIRAGEIPDSGDTLQRAQAVESLLGKALRDAGEQDPQQRLREICADAKRPTDTPIPVPQARPATSDDVPTQEWPSQHWRGPPNRELPDRPSFITEPESGLSKLERRWAAERLRDRQQAKYESPLQRGLNWLKG